MRLGQCYCVYSHSYDREIVYIGCGNLERPWSTSPRNELWSKYYEDKGMPKIKILSAFTSYKEALAEEKLKIQRYRPILNRYGQFKQNKRLWRITAGEVDFDYISLFLKEQKSSALAL